MEDESRARTMNNPQANDLIAALLKTVQTELPASAYVRELIILKEYVNGIFETVIAETAEEIMKERN